jgi:hypothetical protein
MARFYVLPSRPQVGDRFAALLHQFFPGLHWDEFQRVNLAHALADAAECHPDTYVVFRDELPAGERVDVAVRDAFGAEGDDEVLEVRFTAYGELTARRWSNRREAA